MPAKLSVNINKAALLRNSRGNNYPDIVQLAKDCERFGADGITVHPRPDERHIKFTDLLPLKEVITTEFNIEGYPSSFFIEQVIQVHPHQCTLVPDTAQQLTSDHGWDTLTHFSFLKEIIYELKQQQIRTSLFIDPIPQYIEAAAAIGVDRIEFYTGPYANHYKSDKKKAIQELKETAVLAQQLGLGINAGHDLNLENLSYFVQEIPNVLEVSIGHAIFCDALYMGLENTIRMYKHQLHLVP